MKREKFFHLYNSEHNTTGHCLKLATTRSRLELRRNFFSQIESRLTLEQTTYACGRGRHCEFIQESAGQGMGHLKFNELLSPSSTSSSFICWQFSWRNIVERHMQCAQSPMHLVESAAPSGSSRLHSSVNVGSKINKQLQLLFATTLTLTLHHSDVTVM